MRSEASHSGRPLSRPTCCAAGSGFVSCGRLRFRRARTPGGRAMSRFARDHLTARCLPGALVGYPPARPTLRHKWTMAKTRRGAQRAVRRLRTPQVGTRGSRTPSACLPTIGAAMVIGIPPARRRGEPELGPTCQSERCGLVLGAKGHDPDRRQGDRRPTRPSRPGSCSSRRGLAWPLEAPCRRSPTAFGAAVRSGG